VDKNYQGINWFGFRSGPHYSLGITGTVPRAYDIFKAYEGMREQMQIKK
jgi:hypothetical protein